MKVASAVEGSTIVTSRAPANTQVEGSGGRLLSTKYIIAEAMRQTKYFCEIKS